MIFVIDDEIDLAEIVGMYLGDGAKYKIFTSIADAKNIIHEARAVICDYHVGSECGFQFFKSIADHSFIKILMTGEPIHSLPKEFYNYVDSIWSKPLSEENIEEARFLGSSCF